MISGRSRATLDAAQENAVAIPCDVASVSGLDALADSVKRELGSVDALFVNAGISPLTPFDSTTEEA